MRRGPAAVARLPWLPPSCFWRSLPRAFRPFADVNGILGGLRSGTVSATVMSIFNATLAARRDPALQLGLLLPGPSGGVAWAVRKGDQELLRALNDYLGSHRKTASWSRPVVKYFGEDALNLLGRAQQE